MQYLLMIHENEAAMTPTDPNAMRQMSEAYAIFTRDLVESGAFKGGERLYPSTSATMVRVRDGKPLLTDGPYAETREQLSGYYVVEAPDLDAATAIAARIPGALHGAIEVRPIVQMEVEDLRKFGRAS